MSLTNKTKNRFLMMLILMTIIFFCMGLHIFSKPMQKDTSTSNQIFTPDWGVAGTLIGLDNPPFAIGDKRVYPSRVSSPKLPDGIKDVGHRGQPNPELLAELKPNIILDTLSYKENRAVYPQNIPVVETDFGNSNLDVDTMPQWSKYATVTKKISHAIGKPEVADAYIEESHQRIIDAGKKVREYLGDNRKILVVNFWDMRQMSVLHKSSIINLTADLMGLELLSIGKPSKWSSSYVYPDKLYDLPKDTCLIIIKPISEMSKYDSVNSPIWQKSPFFQPNACMYTLEPIWLNGGIEVMLSFANNLESVVSNKEVNDLSYEYHNNINDSAKTTSKLNSSPMKISKSDKHGGTN